MTAGATVYPFVVDLVSGRTPPHGVVLEVGCGAMQYGPLLPGRYVGLDRHDSNHVRDTPTLVAGAEAIPLDDRSVDVVFGVASFYYMEPIERVLSECRRVLRPGGTLLIFDYHRHITRRMQEDGDRAVRHFWGYRELRRYVRGAGFVRVRDLSHRATPGGDVSLLKRPVRRAKRILVPRWTQWLVVEARTPRY